MNEKDGGAEMDDEDFNFWDESSSDWENSLAKEFLDKFKFEKEKEFREEELEGNRLFSSELLKLFNALGDENNNAADIERLDD